MYTKPTCQWLYILCLPIVFVILIHNVTDLVGNWYKTFYAILCDDVSVEAFDWITYPTYYSFRTHLGLMTPYGVNELSLHWGNCMSLVAPNNYLNRCRVIVNWTLRNKNEQTISIHENGFEGIVGKMAGIPVAAVNILKQNKQDVHYMAVCSISCSICIWFGCVLFDRLMILVFNLFVWSIF